MKREEEADQKTVWVSGSAASCDFVMSVCGRRKQTLRTGLVALAGV